MRHIPKVGDKVIYSDQIEITGGVYDDEEDCWITEPTYRMLRLRGYIINYVPHLRPSWRNDGEMNPRFVATQPLPEWAKQILTESTKESPWFISDFECITPLRTFSDWAKKMDRKKPKKRSHSRKDKP